MFPIPRAPCYLLPALLVVITLTLNEHGSHVVARTWPRVKSYGKIYAKAGLLPETVTNQSSIPTSFITTARAGRTLEEENSLSEINSSRSLGDYKDLNGNVSLCSSFNNDTRGGWRTKDGNCVAGPFHLRLDVNESVYRILCPIQNGRFPISQACGWYADCGDEEFTINKCGKPGDEYDSSIGKCSKRKGTCDEDLVKDNGKLSLKQILEIVVRFLLHFSGIQRAHIITNPDDDRIAVESRGEVEQVLQSIEKSGELLFSTGEHVSEPIPTTSVEAQVENICKISSTHGLHPHPVLCSKYIQCGAPPGVHFVKNCGPGTVFNPDLLNCDWPTNVPQCKAGQDGTYVYSNIDGNRLRKRSLSSTSIAGGGSKKIRSVGEKCETSENYITPDDEFCNKYKVCSNSRIVSMTCGRGTMFNPLSSVCDFPDEVNCSSRKVDFSIYGCDKGDSYQTSHPHFCNKFVECDDSVLAIKTCPPGTLYNREESICDHGYRVTCKKPVSLEHDIDVNFRSGNHHHEHEHQVEKRSARVSRSNNLNLACEYNYIAPHPTVCNRFVECEDRRIFIKTCGPGTAFNPEIGQCDWPHKIRERDPNDCTKYKQCVHSLYQTKSCGRNQIYDQRQKNCVNAAQYQINECSLEGRRTTPKTTTAWPQQPTPALAK